MERREFLKLTLGFTAAAGAIAVTAATAQAAPMLPSARNMVPPGSKDAPAAEPAIATQDDVDSMRPEQVRWRRRHWRRRYWRPRVWRRRYWRRPRRAFYY
jgi:hypothetical protein